MKQPALSSPRKRLSVSLRFCVAGLRGTARWLVPLFAAHTAMFPAHLRAQDRQASSTMTLKVKSDIVLLDVVVTDKKGNVLTNLKQDDFSITEDNVPQRIRSFEPPQTHELPPSRGLVVRSTADLPKIGNAPVTLLVLDELNTAFTDMAYSRNRMEKYLLAQPAIMPQPTTLLVVTNTKFQVIQDYTQDRAVLLDALHKHFPEFPWKMMKSGGNSSGGMERVSLSLNSLYQISQASLGTPGRKSVIWVGRGFPSVNLIGLDDYQTNLLQGAMKQLTASMLKSRMTLYTIDPTISVSTQGIETADDLADYESNHDGQPFADEIKFSTLAPATGGRAFFSRNDIDAEVATSIADGANYYTLSYSPTDKSEDPAKYRQIRIKMNDPNLLASTRDGYFKEREDTAGPVKETLAATRATLEADMGQAAMSTVIYNGLTATADKATTGDYKLGVVAGGLRWADAGGGKTQAEITVIVVAFSPKGKALKHASQELFAKVQGSIQNPAQKAIFDVPFDVPNGATRLRFVVRDALTGKIGTADITP